jgi:hypothetical protein
MSEDFRIWHVDLEDGTRINRGAIVRLLSDDGNTRRNWYKFLYQHENGDLTFWGPTNEHGTPKAKAQFTSVTPNKVGAIHKGSVPE